VAPPYRELLRTLAAWPTDGLPVTTLYLDVDGRRHPRRADVEAEAESLLRPCGEKIGDLPEEAARSVRRDHQRMRAFVREDLDRGTTRGLALFSCSGAGLWQEVPLTRPVRGRVVVSERPYVLPLEAVLERAEPICTALVDRQRARLFLTVLGEVEEVTDFLDEVPGRHDQGGWSQARLQRHIEDHVHRHLKRTAEALLRLKEDRGFEHLVLSGSDEVVAELERELHDYVRRTVAERASLPVTAAPGEVLKLALSLEERLEQQRERETEDRLASEVRSGTGRAVAGMAGTIAALEAGRVETLVVAVGTEASGVRCTSCGHLDVGGDRCAVCGRPTREVPDMVEEAVESALRQRCRVETIPEPDELVALGGIGALLRF
jgi:peptide chain release factor subunit 1